MERTCEKYSAGVKRATGWLFAHMFNFYFGEGTVVFIGEGKGGKDINFFITGSWLDANHANNFGMTNDLAHEFHSHIESCQDPSCAEAKKRLKDFTPFFKEGKIPGGEALAIVSACEGKHRGSKVGISRKKGFGSALDEIMPFISWFTEEKEFWVWPEQKNEEG